MSGNKKIVFSIVRQDLLYSYANTLDEVFSFTDVKGGSLSEDEGIRRQEAEGFDFVQICEPSVGIRPCAIILEEETKIPADQLVINITIEDIGLGIRRLIYEIPVNSVIANERRRIDLGALEGLAFTRGYIVRCFVSRRVSVDRGEHMIWHKSNLIFQKTFSATVTADESLFEINWVNFQDEREKAQLLYFVQWNDADVTNTVATDCFEVRANEAFRLQFRRLESNANFGHFATRLVAQDIIRELLLTCLHYADPDAEPMVDSLHDKIKSLMDRCGISFDQAARAYKSDEPMMRLQVQNDVTKILQMDLFIASELGKIKFGGYRQV